MSELPPTPVDHSKPHGWIQWKGTDVCMDTHCVCGHHGHIDAPFAYYYRCVCGRVYEIDGHVTFTAVDPDTLTCSPNAIASEEPS